jgi:hypothetical protein
MTGSGEEISNSFPEGGNRSARFFISTRLGVGLSFSKKRVFRHSGNRQGDSRSSDQEDFSLTNVPSGGRELNFETPGARCHWKILAEGEGLLEIPER